MAYELVLPNGMVKVVTEKDEDLWFALKVDSKYSYRGNSGKANRASLCKGGFNNYVRIIRHFKVSDCLDPVL